MHTLISEDMLLKRQRTKENKPEESHQRYSREEKRTSPRKALPALQPLPPRPAQATKTKPFNSLHYFVLQFPNASLDLKPYLISNTQIVVGGGNKKKY